MNNLNMDLIARFHNMVAFALEDKNQSNFKRLKAIRQTKAYINYIKTGENKSFDISRTDFKTLAFELNNLRKEILVFNDIMNLKFFEPLTETEILYINKVDNKINGVNNDN